MDPFNDVTDEDYVPFLNKLGVDSYKRSFEWMLSDPDFAGILRWLYNNLDQNNALNPREECRYAEIEKSGTLLWPKDLEAAVTCLKEDYPGLPLPGDLESQDNLEDLKVETEMMCERLDILEKQEASLQSLIQQNELTKEQLILETSKLNGAIRQWRVEEENSGFEALAAAKESSKAAREAIGVLANALNDASDTACNEESSSKYFAYGPLDSYRESQALFRSHFDLFCSRKFGCDDGVSERVGLSGDATEVEERISKAVHSYIVTRAALAGVQAKLALAATIKEDFVHPSKIAIRCIEEKSALEQLSLEETILEEKTRVAAAKEADSRCQRRVEAAIDMALARRGEILQDLCWLHTLVQQASVYDSILYNAMRHELTGLVEMMELAAELRDQTMEEADAVKARVEAMNNVCSEYEQSSIRHQTKNYLLDTLSSIFGTNVHEGELPGLMENVEEELEELKGKVEEWRREKKERVDEIKQKSEPIKQRLFNGCTRQPGRNDGSIASLSHSLATRMSEMETRIVGATAAYTRVKNGDKDGLRKLWQWFVAEPTRLPR